MATLTPSPKMQFFTANGVPLSGGKLYTYAAGTGPTIPLATYTDSTGSVPNTNPVVLNARGEASVWLGSSAYYMELKDASDVLIWSSDNISGVATLATLAASGGSSLVGFIQAGTGAVAGTVQSKLRESVSVTDFSGDLQLAFNAASHIKIPKNITCSISSDIVIPSGSTLEIHGLLNGAGRLLPAGSFTLFGTGTVTSTRSGGYVLNLVAGDIVVDGITWTDGSGTFQIGIIPTTTITSLRITNNKFVRTNYAILRNPSSGNVTSAIIANNQFRDIGNNATYGGEPIEWNVGPNDIDLAIIGNVIRNVSSIEPSQGIAIGVAGQIPSIPSPQMSHFIIADNVINGSRQGIHVESAARFQISGNSVRNISGSYGVPGIDVLGIAVYGGTEFSISDNYSDDGIFVSPTVSASVYQTSSTNFFINGNCMSYIITQAAGPNAYAVINGNKTNLLVWRGSLNQVEISNNFVTTAAKTIGLRIDYDLTFGPIVSATLAKTFKLKNNTVIDTLGQPNITILSLSVNSLETTGNNFQVSSSITGMATSNRTFYSAESGGQYGLEYQLGDLVIDTATPARFIVTVAGSRNRVGDTFSTTTVGGNSFEIKSTNYAWANGVGHHEAGQRVSLPSIGPAAATLNTRVVRCYISGASEYIMVLEDAWTTAGTGTIAATNPVTLTVI